MREGIGLRWRSELTVQGPFAETLTPPRISSRKPVAIRAACEIVVQVTSIDAAWRSSGVDLAADRADYALMWDMTAGAMIGKHAGAVT